MADYFAIDGPETGRHLPEDSCTDCGDRFRKLLSWTSEYNQEPVILQRDRARCWYYCVRI